MSSRKVIVCIVNGLMGAHSSVSDRMSQHLRRSRITILDDDLASQGDYLTVLGAEDLDSVTKTAEINMTGHQLGLDGR